MPVKRRAEKHRRAQLTPELRRKIARADELLAKFHRMCATGADRHLSDREGDEMLLLESEIRIALGQQPWRTREWMDRARARLGMGGDAG